MRSKLVRCSQCRKKHRCYNRVNNNLIDIAVTAALKRLETEISRGVEKVFSRFSKASGQAIANT